MRQAKEWQGAGSGQAALLKDETARLEPKPKRSRKECDFLKKSRRVLCKRVRVSFNRWCKDNASLPSTSRRGTGWDNAVAEFFFSSLKKEKIKRQRYPTRDDVKSDVFDDIEGFYNRVRRHSHLDLLSPLAFEQLRTGSQSMSIKAG